MHDLPKDVGAVLDEFFPDGLPQSALVRATRGRQRISEASEGMHDLYKEVSAVLNDLGNAATAS